MPQNLAPKHAEIDRRLRLQDAFGRRIRKFRFAATVVSHGFHALPGSTQCQLCFGWRDDYRHV